ncbi:hypothetical protein DICA0_E35410 [Diutina catenulata]
MFLKPYEYFIIAIAGLVWYFMGKRTAPTFKIIKEGPKAKNGAKVKDIWTDKGLTRYHAIDQEDLPPGTCKRQWHIGENPIWAYKHRGEPWLPDLPSWEWIVVRVERTPDGGFEAKLRWLGKMDTWQVSNEDDTNITK